MNWMQIDAMIYRMMARHDNINDVFKEAMTHFKWSIGQAESAILPIHSRFPTLLDSDASPPSIKKKTVKTKVKAKSKTVEEKPVKAPKKPAKAKPTAKTPVKKPKTKPKTKS